MIFAIIPAAGQSKRMGQHKLLLPLQHKPVIHHLLDELSASEVTTSCIIYRADDQPLQQALHAWQRQHDPAETHLHQITPIDPPPDMRASAEYGLNWIEQQYHPDVHSAWALIPADYPLVKSTVVKQLIAHWHVCHDEILVPTYEGQRGHPTFFRWSLVPLVKQIPYNLGINSLLQQPQLSLKEQPVGCSSVIQDLDTPADFERISNKFLQS